jgi:hypothetical protein
MAAEQSWQIVTRCRWCQSEFQRLEIDGVRAWVCPTEACRERQLRWKRVDLAGKLLYLPLPVQCEVHEAIASQQFGAICIGGERGSSKSIAIRHAIYNACDTWEYFSALLFRRTLVQLDLNQGRFFAQEAHRLGFEYSTKKLVFPKTHAELRFAHSHDPDDYESYIGGDVDLIVLEQIEQFLQKQVAEIGASTGRNTRYDHWRGLLLATENPGGPLSDFVNQIFVRKDLDKEKYPHYNPANYHFIESRLSDNPYTDSRYEQNLAILSPARQAMMRHGRRDIFEGQFFQTFLKETHVTNDPGAVGAKWFASLHFAFNQMGHALLWNILPTNHVYVRAVYRFEQMNEDALVKALNAWAQSLGLKRMPLTYAQPQLFNAADTDRIVGQSIGETLQANDLPVIAGDDDELNGWKRVHALLRPDLNGVPWMRFHSSCEDLINGLSNAMCAENDADLVSLDSPMLSALHALRYGAMSRPVPANMRVRPVYKPGSAGWYIERAKREGQSLAS